MDRFLEQFLTCHQLRCVDDNNGSLTIGKVYDITSMQVEVTDDAGQKYLCPFFWFEPAVQGQFDVHRIALRKGMYVEYTGADCTFSDGGVLKQGVYYPIIYFSEKQIAVAKSNGQIEWVPKSQFRLIKNADMSKNPQKIDMSSNSVDAVNTGEDLDDDPMVVGKCDEKSFSANQRIVCVSDKHELFTKGKHYVVKDCQGCLGVVCDDGDLVWLAHIKHLFEVDDTKMDSTVAKTDNQSNLQAGDQVYQYGEMCIKTITAAHPNGLFSLEGERYPVMATTLALATEENYQLLSGLFAGLTLEPPKKQIKGSDLCRRMIKNRITNIRCYVGNDGDEQAKARAIVVGIDSSGRFLTDFGLFDNAVPYDETGKVLVEESEDE